MNFTDESLAAAMAYKETLPCNGRGVKWTMVTVDKFVSILYPGTYFAPGQEWKGARKKYKLVCPKHGMYKARLDSVYRTEGKENLGNQCQKCDAERTREITAAFVGQTSPDGHLILEHIGYKATPSDVKNGKRGKAIYRYRCAVCGNEDAKGWGNALKKPGHTTHCGCLSKRDSRLKFSRNKKAAQSPCFIYLFSTIGTSAMKLGMSKNVKRRVSQGKNSYENELYVSQELTRADAWAVEQVMLHRLRMIGLTFDLENVPAWSEIQEAGGSEVFAYVDFIKVETQIRDLIREVKELGWEQLLDRYIPIEEMTHHQLLRWNGKRVIQSNGDGYLGQPYSSVFDL